jgi:hypothetical protein
MGAWIVTGHVFVKCREKGLAGDELLPPPNGIARDDALELANDTVSEALINFRDNVLAAGRWDASRGASLTTFFIGNCLLRFANVYRKWRVATRRVVVTPTVDPTLSDSSPTSPWKRFRGGNTRSID